MISWMMLLADTSAFTTRATRHTRSEKSHYGRYHQACLVGLDAHKCFAGTLQQEAIPVVLNAAPEKIARSVHADAHTKTRWAAAFVRQIVPVGQTLPVSAFRVAKKAICTITQTEVVTHQVRSAHIAHQQ